MSDGARALPVLLVLWVLGCGGDEPQPPDASADAAAPGDVPMVRLDAGVAADAGSPPDDPTDAGVPADAEVGDPPLFDGPTGFIGGPCETAADCDYEDAICLTDGHPRGTCSLGCDRLCPDRAGYPTTFCIEPGVCHSRCNFGLFPNSGCRPGYGCVIEERFQEPSTQRSVCVPGEGTGVDMCLRDLAALGVDFEPTVIADRSPDGHPDLTCHVEAPVILHPPVHGVDIVYYDGTPTPNLRVACNMAHALVRTADDLSARGVHTILHVGTYNCRTISGTDRLSRHAHGDAIDIYGFLLEDGTRYTLIDHWEHDTQMPGTVAGTFLYDTAYRWFDERIYHVILTPNYNTAHDNHFHVDLTPGAEFIQLLDDPNAFGFIGPAPYSD